MVLLELGSSSGGFLITSSGRGSGSTCCHLKDGRTKLVELGRVGFGLLSAAAVTLLSTSQVEMQFESEWTLSNIPPSLSGDCFSTSGTSTCKKPMKIQRPKSRKAEVCTVKCVNTCIRGGDGSPGEGPLNIRRPLVVFKQGFRSRKYW